MYDELKTPTLALRPFFTHIQMHRKMAAIAPIRNTTPNTIPEIAVPLREQDTKLRLTYTWCWIHQTLTTCLFHGRINSIFAFIVFLWSQTTHAHIYLSRDGSRLFVSQRWSFSCVSWHLTKHGTKDQMCCFSIVIERETEFRLMPSLQKTGSSLVFMSCFLV